MLGNEYNYESIQMELQLFFDSFSLSPYSMISKIQYPLEYVHVQLATHCNHAMICLVV